MPFPQDARSLDFVALEEWERLIPEAIQRLAAGPDRAAEGVLETALEQAPAEILPHARALLALPGRRPDWAVAFRVADDAAIATLLAALSTDDLAKRSRVLTALGWSRRAEVLAKIRGERGFDPHDVGLDPDGDAFRPLHVIEALHLAFPPEVHAKLPEHQTRWQEAVHPTWPVAPAHASTHRFGGLSSAHCERCAEPVHHLITLDPVPPTLAPICTLRRLELAVCLSCVFEQNGYGGVYFGHDLQGTAGQQAAEEPEEETPSGPLVETRVALLDLGPRWATQSWGRTAGNLNRVGGAPSWVQDAGYADCELCKRKMALLMQLDSYLPLASGGSYYWGNGGVAYVSWCDGCRMSHIAMQCS